MTTVNVDQATFSALGLAQAAINFARANLPYGSANQLADWQATRGGSNPQGQTLPRLKATRDATTGLLEQPHDALPAYFAQDSMIYAEAISAGVALYYGSGNCGEHADLTFCFLCTFGYPDIEIRVASSTVMDHAFNIITWKGCTDPVICDAWPTNAQACLWSQFFANPKRTQPDPGYKVLCRYTIADMGSDLVGDAFQAMDPTHVSTLKPQSKIAGLADSVVQQMLTQKPKGMYNQLSTLSTAFQPKVDYKFGSDLLSQSVPNKEQWSAKVLPVITDVGNKLKLLDPSKRYTSKAV